jgi:hypothetical protein
MPAYKLLAVAASFEHYVGSYTQKVMNIITGTRYATNRKVTGSSPEEDIAFFYFFQFT